ncbi:cyclase family protein [Amaricoccus solimangrovi]|uniref:Cyclase family protein n=1 Tax=Amaricoccus solimangrovi TaxID=2589815 RepID=A0A501WHI6_9RHOB|nr:cyclase family protein [Amaricoccus solimangrovi]TPE48989.1 hypothetical protein FJM51_16315 [Amaricoccus solimangrovi]
MTGRDMEGAWLDLTRPLDADVAIYREGSYSDPPFTAALWADRAAQGYEVWRLTMGTQTGTHIDAPCHFAAGGDTLDKLGAGECVGTFRKVTAGQLAAPGFRLSGTGETHLLIDARDGAMAAPGAVEALLARPARIVVTVGALALDHPDPFRFHRRLAQAGKYLVEDTLGDVGPLPETGEIITLPPRLVGVSGAPVRVLIRGGA